MVNYKQRCIRCKKNMVLIARARQIPVCFDCQMKDINSPIEDPIFKRLFKIPKGFYVENDFLRSIRSNYAKFKTLTKPQVEAFEKTVKEMRKEKKSKKK